MFKRLAVDRMQRWKSTLKHLATVHRQGTQKNIMIFSTARSGTTWLGEILATQGRFKFVNEPFNLRVPVVRETLGLDQWTSLFLPENRSAIERYLRLFIEDRDRDWRFKRETPFTDFWHPVTDRVLFKILFAGEDCIHWLSERLNAHAVLLLRHPIPVALSRNEFPRLQSFLAAPYSGNFEAHELRLAHEILARGNTFETAILDWCLQNAVPLRDADDSWTVLTYEELVVDPEFVLRHLGERLSLPCIDRMRERVLRASSSTVKSSDASRRILRDQSALKANRSWLIEKWRKNVSTEQERRCFDILDAFGIKCYESGRSMPTPRYLLHRPDGLDAKVSRG
jgi:hypothetical protein